MKTNDVRTLVIMLSTLVLVTFVRADDMPYEQILKERDAVLSKILALQESRLSSGLADFEKISAARIALWSFRRDTAGTKEEKIKLQELLVQEHGRHLASLKDRVASGVGSTMDELKATDKFLEAKQVLAELRMKK